MTLSFLLSALVTLPVSAQAIGGGFETLHQFDGFAAGDQMGYYVSGAGDVNGDGFDDVLMSAPLADPGGRLDAGSVYVYSGVDGILLYQWNGAGAGHLFGDSVSSAGDVNADGFADIIVGAPDASVGFGMTKNGSIYVYSGATGLLLKQWSGFGDYDGFGDSVSGAGDVDGDGYDDVIVGAWATDPGGIGQAGSAFVYSIATSSQLHHWDGTATFDYFGWSVSGAGDVDGDGFDDLVVGAKYADSGGLSKAGSVFVYSGFHGAQLHRWDGEVAGQKLGTSVSGAGDVNGDGFDDVIMGGDQAHLGGVSDTGSAYVYSGVSGTLLHKWAGDLGDYLGWAVSGAGDVNGDGFDDVIVGSPNANSGSVFDVGYVHLFSGINGHLLYRWEGASEDIRMGQSVAGAGDVDGDGFADLIVGANGAAPGGMIDAGSVSVFSFQPYLRPSTFTISAATGGVLNLNLDFPTAAALDLYKIILSTTGVGPIHFGVDIPLTLDGMVQETFRGNYPVATHSNLHGALDLNGHATGSMTFPARLPSALIGKAIYMAAVAYPAGNLPEYSSSVAAIKIRP